MAGDPSSEGREEKQRIAGIFDRAAGTYDQLGPRFFVRFGTRLAELADVGPGQHVLDVACGRGASLFAAAERVGPLGHVVGVDLAESMVAEIDRESRLRGLRNIEALVMDGEELAFPDDAFDRVLAGFCLFFFPRWERALAEMLRVLKPGGRLGLSTWGEVDPDWRWLEELIDSYLADPDDDSAQADDKVDFTERPDEMRTVVLRAGFARAEVIAEARESTYTDVDEWWATQWTHGVRGALEQIEARLGPSGLARFEADARRQLQTMRPPESGAIRHVMPVLYTLADKAESHIH